LLSRSAVSADVDEDKLKEFFASIEGKDVAELIKEGSKKLATVSSGGGGGGGGAAPAAGGKAAAAPEPEEEEEEEEVRLSLIDLQPH